MTRCCSSQLWVTGVFMAGTDFSAEAGETVLALTDGTVQQIAEDGLYGHLRDTDAQ